MKKIILMGAGGHAKACIDVIEQQDEFQILGLLDTAEKLGQSLLGYPIMGVDDDLPHLRAQAEYALVTLGQVGSAQGRKRLFALAQAAGFVLPVVRSPLAYVSPHAVIEAGTIVMHQALVNADARIGANCIINTKALVEHDAQIGAHCHIATGALVNGGVQVGEGVFWGSGAVSKEYSQVADKAFIKAGSVAK